MNPDQLADQLIVSAKPLCQIVYDIAEEEVLYPLVHRIEEVLKRESVIVQKTVDQTVLYIPKTSNVLIIRLSQTSIGSAIIHHYKPLKFPDRMAEL